MTSQVLVTPRPQFDFPRLRPDDRCRVCEPVATAHRAGVAPPVLLAATHARSSEWIDLADPQCATVTSSGRTRTAATLSARLRGDATVESLVESEGLFAEVGPCSQRRRVRGQCW